ncbi:hypothetical protein LK994_09420 [Ferruginibacter lapsinanis]|uniref:hypothetical protein n=1 Tax=Ferruginibacter lapsinanis TaxID=563172 RepID=UPI001E520E33|nr:hypothetical protein [Ferruginibacter lapsinanis]UEG48855.1 hypothetical protein LK994_09420 [Ferruginibacter lapsinanis]
MKTQSIIMSILLLFILSCSTSRITNSWKAATIPDKTYNKIMVVGLINNNNRNLREKMEDHLTGDLAEHGYTSVSSLKEYGPKSFENMKESEVVEKLYNSGIDAVITIVLLDKQREKYYVPGNVYYSPYSVYHRHFWGYYSTIYDRIYTPGYYMVDTKYFWESNFYDLQSKELLYSVQTRSFNPSSAEELAHEYGKMIVGNMAENGIIKR